MTGFSWWQALLLILAGQFVWAFLQAWHRAVEKNAKEIAARLARKERFEIVGWRWRWHRLTGKLVVRIGEKEGYVKVTALS